MSSDPDEHVRRVWRARLRAAGMRVTPQREAVLASVHRLRHATPDSILRDLDENRPAVNLSTVYRSLEALESVGLVRHTHLGPGTPVYHVTAESPHIHLRCDSCGALRSVPIEAAATFVAQLRQDTGFRADIGHAAIHGRCRACADRAPAPPEGERS